LWLLAEQCLPHDGVAHASHPPVPNPGPIIGRPVHQHARFGALFLSQKRLFDDQGIVVVVVVIATVTATATVTVTVTVTVPERK